MDKTMRVVGIGASAGGLEAIIDFFENVPADLNMAFIVIQHLSPDHKSLMDELLRKHTSLTIEVISEARELLPNHIFLISAQSNVLLENGRLRPVGRSGRGHLNLPIDQFFHSLAEECGSNAVGIILSGTGTDGSRGIQAIKNNGGIVLVQDPDTAQFDGMPQAAILTGVADQVLPPAAIAEALNSIFQRKKDGLLLLDSQDDQLGTHLETILEYVIKHAGVDFRDYRRTTLLRRIEKRMLVKKLDRIEAYVDLLADSPQEAHLLHQEFLIGVTRFFRDAPAFEILRTEVIPHLARRRDTQDSLRIWCAGCSTGEEAYTLALLLEEYARYHKITPFHFKLFASDLDARAIEVAKRGIYSALIEHTVPSELIERYFTKTTEGFQIDKEVRERMVFTVHDALADPPFIKIDLVTCRNLLIYLNTSSQQQLLNNFQFSLRENSYLFLGPSESLGQADQYFEPISERWNLFRLVNKQRLLSGRKLRLPRRIKKGSDGDQASADPAEPATWEIRKIKNYYQTELLRRFAPTSIYVDSALTILYSHGPVQRLFGFPRSAEDFDLRSMVDLEYLPMFENGVQRALESGKTFTYENVPYSFEGRRMRLHTTFDALRAEDDSQPVVLIQFTILSAQAKKEEAPEIIDEETYRNEQIRTLERHLSDSMKARQALLERLDATNEELQSSNEELMAANEEMQSTNEELQSLNEELYTVNSELQNKVEELTLTNSDLDNLLESTDVGTIFVDRNLRIRKFTPAIQRQFDLLNNDIGRPITNFVNTFADDSIYANATRVIESGEMIEREIIDARGTYFLLRILPYRLGDRREIDGVVISFTDITPLRSALADKKEQAERFTALFEHADASIAIIDPADNILEINRDAFGLDRDELIDANLLECLKDPHFVSRYAQAKQDVLRTQEPAQFIAPIRRPGEPDLWFASMLIPIHTDQELKRLVLMSRDETQPGRLLGETHRKIALFNAWYQYGNQHIMTVDAEGTILDLNYSPSGYAIKAILGRKLLDILPEENRPQHQQVMNRLLGGEQIVTYESTLAHPDGSAPMYFENLVVRIDPRDGEELHFIWISRDATEMRRLRQRVGELEKRISTNLEEQSAELLSKNRELQDINYYLDSFVQSAAHDLRAPVTQLDGFLELTNDENASELFPEIRQNMLTAVRQLRQTIDGLVEMIDFEKHDHSKAKEIDVNAKVEHMVEQVRQNYPSVKIDLRTDLDPDLRIAYPEPYIRSLLHNLLDNAVKYRSHPDAVRVTVQTRCNGPNEIMISVRDNGIGIDTNRYGHLLFQPFKRLTAERPGTGIGLSIVNNAIRRNGGRFEVDSKLGAGSEFKAYLVAYEVDRTNE